MSSNELNVVVTGANRGLGLGFARRWSSQGRRVFALCRDPRLAGDLNALAADADGRVQVLACDVGADGSVEGACTAVTKFTDRVDILVNNAGVYGEKPKQGSLDALDFAELRRVFEINTIGPLRVMRTFLPLLRRSERPRVAHLTSLMGSIGDNGSGSNYAYRMSKAALNMATRNLGHEMTTLGVPAVAIHPGWVATDMGGGSAPLGVEESVEAMCRTIESIEPAHAGRFVDREGKDLPW